MPLMTPPPLEQQQQQQQEHDEMFAPQQQQQEDDEMLVPHSLPMEEAAQPEAPNSHSSRFTWRIEKFSRLNTKKLYSDVFLVGGFKWRILIFPKGNNVDYLSMYLDVADSSTLADGWSRHAQFSLAVVNQMDQKLSIRKDTRHQFNTRESDWGFTSLMPLEVLHDPARGYLVNDTCIVELEAQVDTVRTPAAASS